MLIIFRQFEKKNKLENDRVRLWVSSGNDSYRMEWFVYQGDQLLDVWAVLLTGNCPAFPKSEGKVCPSAHLSIC